MSQPHNSRLVDYLALKDSEDTDPMGTFELDLVGDYYQTEQDELMFVLPPEEWLAKRRSAGLPTDVGW